MALMSLLDLLVAVMTARGYGSPRSRGRRNHCSQTHLRDLAAHVARGLLSNFLTLLIRGRRECRAPDAPAAARAMIVVERARVSQVTPESPGIPRAMVLRFPSCSPAIGLFCHRHRRNCFHRLDTSVEMSGPHDFTVRSGLARLAGQSVHRIPPRRP